MDNTPTNGDIGNPIGKWAGVLTIEGAPTGDGRTFAPNSLTWDLDANAGMPLRWTPTDNGNHQGAIHVGWITSIQREPLENDTNTITATGTYFDTSFDDFIKNAGKIGLSVDVDSEQYDVTIPTETLDTDPVPGETYPVLQEQLTFTAGRIRAVTAVDIPAFDAGYLEPTGTITAATATPAANITHAGILLSAGDTGRWLLLQRAYDETDENAGLWEFPGGGVEGDEAPFEAAVREFGEEVGVPIAADALLLGRLDSGIYRLHIMAIPIEEDLNIDGREVVNPDDPDGDVTEAVAWWSPDHIISGGFHIRPEVQSTDWAAVLALLASEETPMADETTPVDAAIDLLQQAIDLHNGHMDGSVPTDEASQQQLADLIVAAEEALEAVDSTTVDGPVDEEPVMAAAGDETGAGDLDLLNTLREHFDQILSALTAPDLSPAVQEYADNLAEQLANWLSGVDGLLSPEVEVTEGDSLTAAAAPVAPPDEWFTAPPEADRGPLTVTADGRVSGYLATWDSCHRSEQYRRRGECVQPPSDPDAPVFQLGQVLTASGALIDVGRITVGGGHADINGNIAAALEHYDDVSTVVAAVRVIEDERGIGLYGSIVPEATAEQVAALRRAPLSGDWRKERGKYRLIAAHAVVVPGFPVPRSLVASISPEAFITTQGDRGCSSCGEDSAPLGIVASAFLRETLRNEFDEAKRQMRESLSATFGK